MKKTGEAAVQKAILQYLAARHVFAIRVNSGTHFSESNGKRYVTRLAAPGTADILALPSQWRGVDDKGTWCEFREIKVLWLEVKSATGKQSDLQKSFQAQVEAEGHRYAVCRSVQDVEDLLK